MIPFTIENYQKLVVEAGTHEVKDIQGWSTRILCTDRPHQSHPIVGLACGNEIRAFTKRGRFISSDHPSYKDLQIVPKPPKSLGWMNVYSTHGSVLYNSKEDADRHAVNFRRACIEVFEGQGL